ncbi:uncharacterized protein LOC110824751 [Carica papaya]|uniref:uncharacterized protein LOC110824751 n=1 Tax=Carica papaya TaxID=3649 RepID=UPI000B8C76B3|nr:uncharacterized protein LOC110824751 [Carica papaya]
MKNIMRFGKKEKLSPHFIGPFKILERVETITYQLALPPNIANIHDVFHVSMLQKYHPDPSHVLQYEDIPIEKDMSYQKIPIGILDRQERVLRNKTIPMVKVLWQHNSPVEAT